MQDNSINSGAPFSSQDNSDLKLDHKNQKGSLGGRAVESGKPEDKTAELGEDHFIEVSAQLSLTTKRLLTGKNNTQIVNDGSVSVVSDSVDQVHAVASKGSAILFPGVSQPSVNLIHLEEEIVNLDSLIQNINLANSEKPRLFNESSSDIFQVPVDNLLKLLNSDEMIDSIKDNLFLKAMHKQVLNNLKHINLESAHIDPNYPHDPVLTGPYPFDSSLIAVKSVKNFFCAIKCSESAEIPRNETPGEIATMLKKLEKEESAFIRKVVENPLGIYTDFQKRLKTEGSNAKFPEFEGTIKYLELSLKTEEISAVANKDPSFSTMRKQVFDELQNIKKSGYPYCKVIDAIESVLGFLDVFERGKVDSKVAKKLFHSDRYQYYGAYLKGQIPDHFVFPTFSGLGATDLLKVRGVPIGFVGVHTEPSWVDGYSQSPLEFWYHDVNHTRRMWQFFKEEAKNQGISVKDFAQKSHQYTNDHIRPLITVKKDEDYEVQNQKRMMKMIFFEMLHEDALTADPDVIAKTLMRPPNAPSPVESMNGNQVQYQMENGATTLAFVYRKIAGNFYDMEGMRNNFIIGHDRRTRECVAQAALIMSEKIGLSGVHADKVKEYTQNDEGLPSGFLATVKEFMERNPGIMEPLSTDLDKGE